MQIKHIDSKVQFYFVLLLGIFLTACNQMSQVAPATSTAPTADSPPITGNDTPPQTSTTLTAPPVNPPVIPAEEPAPAPIDPPAPPVEPARARTVYNVSSQVEISIPPFNERYPGNSVWGYRELSNVVALGSRVYVGHGSSAVGGPTDIWYFDTLRNVWIKEAHATEEVLNRMRVKDGVIYYDGNDSMGSGNFYRRELVKGWQSYHIGPDGHPRDAFPFGGFVFTNTAYSSTGFPGLAIFNDTTHVVTVPVQSSLAPGRSSSSYSEFFEHRGVLYALGDGNYDPLILRFSPTNLTAPWSVAVNARADLKGAPVPFRILKVSDTLSIYSEFPNSLYGIHNIEDVDIQNIPIPGQSLISAFLSPVLGEDGYLYLVGIKAGTPATTRSLVVYYSSDGLHWFQYTAFDVTLPTTRNISRVTASKNGDLFFNINDQDFGTPKAPYPAFIRVRKQAIDGVTKPVVSLSLPQIEIWEASGSKINFKINRTGPTTSALTVPIQFTGTALNGVHYVAPSNRNFVIPIGQSSLSVDLDLVNNGTAESDKALIIAAADNTTYEKALPSSVTVTIRDDDSTIPAISHVGMKLWLKADAGVIADSSGLVSEWRDQSGNGFKGTQTVLASRPTLVASAISSKPAIRFDGSNDFLNIGSIADQVYFAAFVFKNKLSIQATSPSMSIMNFMGSIEGGVSGIEFGGGVSPLAIYFNAWMKTPPPIVSAVPHTLIVQQPRHAALYNFKLDGVNLDVAYLDITNPNQADPKNSPDLARTITLYGSDVKIGTRTGTGRFFNGDIAEIILYNRPLSPAEMLAVETYLSVKY